jgi:hypothetical protein
MSNIVITKENDKTVIKRSENKESRGDNLGGGTAIMDYSYAISFSIFEEKVKEYIGVRFPSTGMGSALCLWQILSCLWAHIEPVGVKATGTLNCVLASV